MHEISVLYRAVELAEETAKENGISRLSYITLEVGELSGYLPVFFEKYFPVVIEGREVFEGCELRMTRPAAKRSARSVMPCTASWNAKANVRAAGPGTRRSWAEHSLN